MQQSPLLLTLQQQTTPSANVVKEKRLTPPSPQEQCLALGNAHSARLEQRVPGYRTLHTLRGKNELFYGGEAKECTAVTQCGDGATIASEGTTIKDVVCECEWARTARWRRRGYAVLRGVLAGHCGWVHVTSVMEQQTIKIKPDKGVASL